MHSLPRIFALATSAGLALAGASLSRADMALLQESPFLPANARPSTAAIVEGGPLMLSAVIDPDGKGQNLYSITYTVGGGVLGGGRGGGGGPAGNPNAPKKASVMVHENETFTSSDGSVRFTILSHQVVDGGNQVTVRYQNGQQLVLAQKTPKIGSSNAPARGVPAAAAAPVAALNNVNFQPGAGGAGVRGGGAAGAPNGAGAPGNAGGGGRGNRGGGGGAAGAAGGGAAGAGGANFGNAGGGGGGGGGNANNGTITPDQQAAVAAGAAARAAARTQALAQPAAPAAPAQNNGGGGARAGRGGGG